jgi:hypothetical protein
MEDLNRQLARNLESNANSLADTDNISSPIFIENDGQ